MTAPTVTFPGEIRGWPAFRVDPPAGWELAEQAGCLAIVFAPVSAAPFRANVVFGLERVGVGFETGDVARESLTLASQDLEDLRLEDERIVTAAGLGIPVRRQSFVDGRVEGRLVQVIGLAESPSRGETTWDLLQITATCGEAEIDDHLPRILDLIASLDFITTDDA